MVNFAKPYGIKIDMKDKAMIVEGVHGVTAIGEYLGGGFLFEKFSSEGKIFFGVF
jgi:hypothetical protein